MLTVTKTGCNQAAVVARDGARGINERTPGRDGGRGAADEGRGREGETRSLSTPFNARAAPIVPWSCIGAERTPHGRCARNPRRADEPHAPRIDKLSVGCRLGSRPARATSRRRRWRDRHGRFALRRPRQERGRGSPDPPRRPPTRGWRPRRPRCAGEAEGRSGPVVPRERGQVHRLHRLLLSPLSGRPLRAGPRAGGSGVRAGRGVPLRHLRPDRLRRQHLPGGRLPPHRSPLHRDDRLLPRRLQLLHVQVRRLSGRRRHAASSTRRPLSKPWPMRRPSAVCGRWRRRDC